MSLSDKIRKWNNDPCEEHILLTDVKQFIKELKESLAQGIKRNRVLPQDWAFDRIDELAGEGLI